MLRSNTMWMACLLSAGLGSGLGCNVADPALFEGLPSEDGGAAETGTDTIGGGDAVVVEQDAVDECGGAGATIIDSTRIGLTINTEVLENAVDVTSSCGIASRGPDGFIGLEVQAGQVWHFHLRVVGRTDRNPSLYLLRDTCNTRQCEQVADSCTAAGEEHFAFVPDAPGRWFIGIDDGEVGGAQYVLDAYLTLCNTMETEHGESCDGTGGVRDDNCSNDCRIILNSSNRMERFPNQNFVEANLLDLSESPLIIMGDVGDPSGQCTYPDVFTVVLDNPTRLLARPEECSAAADARYELSLLSPSGSLLQGGMRNGDNCPFIDSELMPGRYFIRVDQRPFADQTFTAYQLRFEAMTL